MKNYDIVALGELLIDFTQAGYSPEGMRLFEQNPGGAVANVLAAAAKFGRSTAFMGKVGRDMHGSFLKNTLAGSGIDVKALVEDPDVFTTLAFVQNQHNDADDCGCVDSDYYAHKLRELLLCASANAYS